MSAPNLTAISAKKLPRFLCRSDKNKGKRSELAPQRSRFVIFRPRFGSINLPSLIYSHVFHTYLLSLCSACLLLRICSLWARSRWLILSDGARAGEETVFPGCAVLPVTSKLALTGRINALTLEFIREVTGNERARSRVGVCVASGTSGGEPLGPKCPPESLTLIRPILIKACESA